MHSPAPDPPNTRFNQPVYAFPHFLPSFRAAFLAFFVHKNAARRPRFLHNMHYVFISCSAADRYAPPSNSNPDTNAQNISVTDIENGPYTSSKFSHGRAST